MTRPIHILQVVHSLYIGGTEQVVADLVRSFNGEEFRTSVCCLDGLGELGEELRAEGVAVHVLARKPGVDFSMFSQLRDLYRREKIDLVHAHQYTPYFYAAGGSMRAERVPVIFTEHGRHWPDRLRIKRAIVNQLLRLTTASYTAVSEFTRQSLIRYEKMPANSVQVIYNGIRLDCGEAHGDGRQRVRHEAGLENHDRLILSVGRLDRIKDFATLIRAFNRLAETVPNIYLWIAGAGDPAYKAELIALIGNLSLQEKVKLLGSRRDVKSLLLASDLFALPSITEAASMTLLEAMAAGRAVVTTQTGGNSELVADGKTGLLVPVGDVAAMAEAMMRLLEDPDRRVRMGQLGRDRVRERFAREITVAQYRNLYLSINEKSEGSLLDTRASLSSRRTPHRQHRNLRGGTLDSRADALPGASTNTGLDH